MCKAESESDATTARLFLAPTPLSGFRSEAFVVKMKDAAVEFVKTEHADSLGVQSFVPVSPPLQTVGAISSPRGRISGADHILQRAGLCTHGRQRSKG